MKTDMMIEGNTFYFISVKVIPEPHEIALLLTHFVLISSIPHTMYVEVLPFLLSLYVSKQCMLNIFILLIISNL